MGDLRAVEWKQLLPYIDKAVAGNDPWAKSTEPAKLKSLKGAGTKVTEELDSQKAKLLVQMSDARKRSQLKGTARLKGRKENRVQKKVADQNLVQHKKTVKRLRNLRREADSVLSTVDKKEAPARFRALKALVKGLDNIVGKASYTAKDMEKDLAIWGTEITTESHFAKQEGLALKNLKKCAKNALAGIQVVKSDPSPEGWERAFVTDKAGRQLHMGLQLMEKAQKKNPNIASVELSKTTGFLKDISPYKDSGALKLIDEGAEPKAVLLKLKEFTVIAKEIVITYQKDWKSA